MPDFDISRRSPPALQLRNQIFRGSDAVADGLISYSRLRREYTRVLHGVYVPRGTDVDHGIRTLAALRVMPSESVLTAHSSAWWYGVESAEPTDPVMVILPTDAPVKGPRGVRVHTTTLTEGESRLVGGIRLASPLRTAWDAAVLAQPRTALAMIDGLLGRHIVTRQLLDGLLARAGTWGIARARPVIELADGRSESPAESWTRWLLHQACIPPAELQFEVRDAEGQFVARVDFAWPDRKVALEYDGAYHEDPIQQAADRRRDDALAQSGWTVIHMTASDLRDPSRVLRELRRALGL